VRTTRSQPYGCQMTLHATMRVAGPAGGARLPAGTRRRKNGCEWSSNTVPSGCRTPTTGVKGNLGHLLPVKKPGPAADAVGGPAHGKQERRPASRAGAARGRRGVRNHNIGSRPGLLRVERAGLQAGHRRDRSRSQRFPSVLPAGRVPLRGVGRHRRGLCHNTLHVRIVPSLRGREEDRRPGDVLAETPRPGRRRGHRGSRCSGSRTFTSYGVGFRAGPHGRRSCCWRRGDRGLERVTLPLTAPADCTDDVIEAMAAAPTTSPAAAAPLPRSPDSGRVLRANAACYAARK